MEIAIIPLKRLNKCYERDCHSVLVFPLSLSLELLSYICLAFETFYFAPLQPCFFAFMRLMYEAQLVCDSVKISVV